MKILTTKISRSMVNNHLKREDLLTKNKNRSSHGVLCLVVLLYTSCPDFWGLRKRSLLRQLYDLYHVPCGLSSNDG